MPVSHSGWQPECCGHWALPQADTVPRRYSKPGLSCRHLLKLYNLIFLFSSLNCEGLLVQLRPWPFGPFPAISLPCLTKLFKTSFKLYAEINRCNCWPKILKFSKTKLLFLEQNELSKNFGETWFKLGKTNLFACLKKNHKIWEKDIWPKFLMEQISDIKLSTKLHVIYQSCGRGLILTHSCPQFWPSKKIQTPHSLLNFILGFLSR